MPAKASGTKRVAPAKAAKGSGSVAPERKPTVGPGRKPSTAPKRKPAAGPRRAAPAKRAGTKPAGAAKGTAAAKPKADARAVGTAAGDGPRRIDARIRDLVDWRGEALARMRGLMFEADPEVVEEVKWVKPSNPWGVAVWSHAGIVCTGEVYKSTVKLTFARGAPLEDPHRLFNAGLDGGTRRAIDIHEGETVDADAFRALFREAVALNEQAKAR